MNPPPKRFAVALSFPSEYRDFVEELAEFLATKLGRDRVLYDKYYEHEFARPDLDLYLPSLYRNESELTAIFICNEYAGKKWCKLEWRSIRQWLGSADQSRIMFLSFDEIGQQPEIGIFSGDGYVFIGQRSAAEIGEVILRRLQTNSGARPPVAAPFEKPKTLPPPAGKPSGSTPGAVSTPRFLLALFSGAAIGFFLVYLSTLVLAALSLLVFQTTPDHGRFVDPLFLTLTVAVVSLPLAIVPHFDTNSDSGCGCLVLLPILGFVCYWTGIIGIKLFHYLTQHDISGSRLGILILGGMALFAHFIWVGVFRSITDRNQTPAKK